MEGFFKNRKKSSLVDVINLKIILANIYLPELR